MVFTFAFVMTYFYNAWPSGPGKSLMQIAYSATFGFFDRSSFIIFLIIIAGSAVFAYASPNVGTGLFDFAFLLMFAFIFTSFRTPFIGIMDAMEMQIIYPNTYALMNSNWTAIFVMFSLALEGIFNFRSVPQPTQQVGDSE